MKETPQYWAVVPAAGVGSRMASDIPKQYLTLNNRKVIEHTLEALLSHAAIKGAVVAIGDDDEYWQDVTIATDKPVWKARGGIERCHSVLNALELLSEHAGIHDWVLVHDAARPCLRHADIDLLIRELKDYTAGGLLAVPVRDTMKRADGAGNVDYTEEREGLWHALTPQMFHLKTLIDALQRAIAAGTAVTDEASAMENVGLRPRLVEGHADNIKITRPEDLQLAAFYLSQLEAGEVARTAEQESTP